MPTELWVKLFRIRLFLAFALGGAWHFAAFPLRAPWVNRDAAPLALLYPFMLAALLHQILHPSHPVSLWASLLSAPFLIALSLRALGPFYPLRPTPQDVLGEVASGLYTALVLGFLGGGGLLPREVAATASDLAAWASLGYLVLYLPLRMTLPRAVLPPPGTKTRASVPLTPSTSPLQTPKTRPEPSASPPPEPRPAEPKPPAPPTRLTLEELKARLRERLVLPRAAEEEILKAALVLTDPEGYQTTWGLPPPRGLLLHGPPGTGKTSVARFLAEALGLPFYAVSPADLKSKWYGESEARTKALLEEAASHPRALVFVDEAEALLGAREEVRHEVSRNLVALFLQYLEGLKPSQLFLVLATNYPDQLDPALLSRLAFHVRLPLPGPEERETLLRRLLPHGRYLEEDLAALVTATEGLSGRDLRTLVGRATLRAHAEGRRFLTLEDFLAELPS